MELQEAADAGVSVFAGGAASVFVVLGSVSGDSGDSVFVDGVEAAGLGAKNPRSDSWPAAGLAIVFFGADMLPLAQRGLASAGKCMGGTGGRRFTLTDDQAGMISAPPAVHRQFTHRPQKPRARGILELS